MKKLLYSLIAIFITFGVSAQTFTSVHNYQAPDGLEVIKHLGIPYGSDTSDYVLPDTVKISGIARKSAPIFFQTSDSTFYIHWGKWIAVGRGGSVDLSNYYDTAQVNSIAGGKVDTSYQQKLVGFNPIYFEQITKDSANVRFKNDSIPLLTYAPGVDTGRVNALDIPSKGWVLSRLTGGGGGGSYKVIRQVYTSGSSVTATDSTTWLIINPSSLVAALTITMASSPTDGQDLIISFGGTMTTGTVVTSLTISGGVIQATSPGEIEAGEAIKYRYNSNNSKWYRL